MNSLQIFKKELLQQSEALKIVADKVEPSIERIINEIYSCKGKVIVTGMGKTGIIGRKIAATLSSTGTIAIFLHAAEGIHGDLGIIDKEDIIIAISNSGSTPELISIIPYFKLNKNKIIALTGNMSSKLATSSDFVIDCSIPENYDPFGLVPTASTTVALAIGDAIAVALLKKRNFEISDFALFHPGGTIGKKMLLKVEDLMHSNKKNPTVNISSTMKKAILEMTSKGLGCTNVVENKKLVGIITDGDLRRL
ncbi:MAG: KpsF/GutQ family sugar-phosphate isomerase, partial [Candidatus Cloacimonadota bacterium]|nr:KpsF/GutQ family sugar-phosphate isomerase [Candidatus Cloacimonadota bacterium]